MEKQISQHIDYRRTGDKKCVDRNSTTANWFVTPEYH